MPARSRGGPRHRRVLAEPSAACWWPIEASWSCASRAPVAGSAWVGPPPAAMRALGDKAAARRLATRAGVPVLAGYDGDDQSDGRLQREGDAIGYPLLLKPS